MDRSRLMRAGACAALVALVCATLAIAGDLNPPAGPVAPTPGPNPATVINSTNTPGNASAMFIIDMPGSYRLDGNLNVGGMQAAIKVTAPNVQIRLDGFTISGTAPPGQNGDGVVVDVTDTGGAQVSVENGFISGFANGVNAVNMPNNRASHVRLDRVNTSNNDMNGMLVGNAPSVQLYDVNAGNNGAAGIEAPNSVVNAQRVDASDNTGRGVNAGAGSTLAHVKADENDSDGVHVQPGSGIDHLSASNNGGAGVLANAGSVRVNDFTTNGNAGHGIAGGTDMSINDGHAGGNGGDGVNMVNGLYGGVTSRSNSRGLAATGAVRVRNSKSSANKSTGFELGDDSSLDGSEADGNATGAIMGNRGNVSNSSFSSNAISGLVGGQFTNVSSSTAASNTQFGYSLGQSSCIHQSDAFFNGVGISASGGSRVSENRAGSNGEGIRASGPATISHNTLNTNTTGVRVLSGAPGSQIIFNYFKSHTFSGPAVRLEGNYVLVTNNHFHDNTTDVVDVGLNNKIAPIQCDLPTAGPYDNWRLDQMR